MIQEVTKIPRHLDDSDKKTQIVHPKTKLDPLSMDADSRHQAVWNILRSHPLIAAAESKNNTINCDIRRSLGERIDAVAESVSFSIASMSVNVPEKQAGVKTTVKATVNVSGQSGDHDTSIVQLLADEFVIKKTRGLIGHKQQVYYEVTIKPVNG